MLNAERTYYIKLGEGGKWAEESIKTGIARIGWASTPLSRILAGDWTAIKEALRKTAKSPGAGTADANALERFSRSTELDVWVTFHNSRLFWGRLRNGSVEEDSVSKYRRLVDGWRDTSMKKTVLLANQIPGQISQLQGFRATICQVKAKEALLRLLGGERSQEYISIDGAQATLILAVAAAIKNLHWKDFELLVDLVFRQSGWRRVSAVGEKMKSVDIELEDTITGDQYQVQVKSRATTETAAACRAELSSSSFRKSYLVVHSWEGTPFAMARDSQAGSDAAFEVILCERLSRMVVEAGLTGWLRDKLA